MWWRTPGASVSPAPFLSPLSSSHSPAMLLLLPNAVAHPSLPHAEAHETPPSPTRWLPWSAFGEEQRGGSGDGLPLLPQGRCTSTTPDRRPSPSFPRMAHLHHPRSGITTMDPTAFPFFPKDDAAPPPRIRLVMVWRGAPPPPYARSNGGWRATVEGERRSSWSPPPPSPSVARPSPPVGTSPLETDVTPLLSSTMVPLSITVWRG
ncbi:uncharacterized protein [Miscanthus floridulus]|uniref:uncharacterized protein n=1 Tax=Miscanthus floridulus TaxID=154761 RepID=UPI00345ACFEC